ncbi:3-oxoacyl-[acyl-carrier-protein] reductase [Nannizzia gypsea CBS 118893]|uniref:3-oxoacyl-[acyl-carrier-protein] reductase n=1 Tax=Arthroderma gypseum (strain ATCC MYA-4604 / CBS 118893) TaxID=535722 RepID=E4UXT0_ARTGP|nr:3-oxoacyl-[acyl-carrier-protein] reductase [Nannizzia gypsea CBS 118893]EFR01975.1 3-oxoacyl-[acyl-carrier-protein] reductase [Nannizzia gypsea CBS 118893]
MPSSVAIVTGGAGDIGLAIARRLSDSHDKVVILDIDSSRLDAALAALNDSDKFDRCLCDITDSKQVAELPRRILGQRGEQNDAVVHTLVNNAGGSAAYSLHETTPTAWQRETALNLDAAFFCFSAFQDDLKRSRGSVINIVSVNGLAVYGNPAYSAAKAGLIHLTKSIAVEYGRYGIRANAVAPGTVRTAAWTARQEANPHVFQDVAQWYPLNRIVEPEDVANAVAFLASEQAAAITGICLPVDCGLTAGQTAVARTITQSEHY